MQRVVNYIGVVPPRGGLCTPPYVGAPFQEVGAFFTGFTLPRVVLLPSGLRVLPGFVFQEGRIVHCAGRCPEVVCSIVSEI